MQNMTQVLTANTPVEFYEKADFFRLMNAAAVAVQFYRDGRMIVDSAGVSGGYAEKFDQPFDRFTLNSATGQTVQFVTRLGSVVSYDIPPTGNVTVTGNVEVTNDVGNALPVSGTVAVSNQAALQGALAHYNASVSNASQSLAPAKADRRYLAIQNNDPVAVLRVRFDGTAPTATTGIRVQPGGVYELQGYCPTGQALGIMEAASAVPNNIEIVQG